MIEVSYTIPSSIPPSPITLKIYLLDIFEKSTKAIENIDKSTTKKFKFENDNSCDRLNQN